MRDVLNKQGVKLLDVYVLNYHNVLVFFRVCKSRENSVYLVELATKKYKNGIMLCKNLIASKKPLVILKNNTYTKSEYKVYPVRINDEYWLPIKVEYGDELFYAARMNTDYPCVGYAYAVRVEEYYNKYWILEKQEVKELVYC